MGLLEKAQQKKAPTKVTEEIPLTLRKKQQRPVSQPEESHQYENIQETTEAFRLATPQETSEKQRSLPEKTRHKKPPYEQPK